MTHPEPLSVLILTKDEEKNLPECLDALLPQLAGADEVVIVDSASRDATMQVARAYADAHPGRFVLHGYAENVPFGAARNRGIEMARNDVVVMLSADAVPEPGWADAMRRALGNADIVYGRQRHAPDAENAATVARGLRYHHFERPTPGLPEDYASNVNAAYRRLAFATLRFTEASGGAEDVVFAREARLAGLRISYAPDAVVRHKDVASFRAEWRKNAREGAAYAQLGSVLGAPRMHLAWASVVAVLGIFTVAFGSAALLALTLLAFFAPTLRRLASPVAKRYKARSLVGGALASPLFDVAFLGSYLARRVKP